MVVCGIAVARSKCRYSEVTEVWKLVVRHRSYINPHDSFAFMFYWSWSMVKPIRQRVYYSCERRWMAKLSTLPNQ